MITKVDIRKEISSLCVEIQNIERKLQELPKGTLERYHTDSSSGYLHSYYLNGIRKKKRVRPDTPVFIDLCRRVFWK